MIAGDAGISVARWIGIAHGLRQRLALQREQAGGRVEPFLHDRREGAAAAASSSISLAMPSSLLRTTSTVIGSSVAGS